MFCIYHRMDLDGKCSAAIVKQKYPEAELVPYNYGDDLDLEQFRGEEVIMVDVSLQPYDSMLILDRMCALTWIDHHKTAIENHLAHAPLNGKVILKNGKAGCELTWKWAFPDASEPKAVSLLGRYDVWDLDEERLAFQYGMRQNVWEPDDAKWRHLLANTIFTSPKYVPNIVEEGRILLKYIQTQNKISCGSAFEVTLTNKVAALRCICLNTGGTNSQIFDSIWDPEKHDAMLVFSNRGNKHWNFSLYSYKEDIDVGAFAKAQGGGGHKGAAGFQMNELPPELTP